MLVLTRKTGQAILVDKVIEVVILRIEGNQIRLGIKAPADITILRAELLRNRKDFTEQIDENQE